jgi:hypothetical protein
MKYLEVYLSIVLFIMHGHIIYYDGCKQDIPVLYCNCYVAEMEIEGETMQEIQKGQVALNIRYIDR